MKTKVLFFVLASAFLAMMFVGCDNGSSDSGDTGPAGAAGRTPVELSEFVSVTLATVNPTSTSMPGFTGFTTTTSGSGAFTNGSAALIFTIPGNTAPDNIVTLDYAVLPFANAIKGELQRVLNVRSLGKRISLGEITLDNVTDTTTGFPINVKTVNVDITIPINYQTGYVGSIDAPEAYVITTTLGVVEKWDNDEYKIPVSTIKKANYQIPAVGLIPATGFGTVQGGTGGDVYSATGSANVTTNIPVVGMFSIVNGKVTPTALAATNGKLEDTDGSIVYSTDDMTDAVELGLTGTGAVVTASYADKVGTFKIKYTALTGYKYLDGDTSDTSGTTVESTLTITLAENDVWSGGVSPAVLGATGGAETKAFTSLTEDDFTFTVTAGDETLNTYEVYTTDVAGGSTAFPSVTAVLNANDVSLVLAGTAVKDLVAGDYYIGTVAKAGGAKSDARLKLTLTRIETIAATDAADLALAVNRATTVTIASGVTATLTAPITIPTGVAVEAAGKLELATFALINNGTLTLSGAGTGLKINSADVIAAAASGVIFVPAANLKFAITMNAGGNAVDAYNITGTSAANVVPGSATVTVASDVTIGTNATLAVGAHALTIGAGKTLAVTADGKITMAANAEIIMADGVDANDKTTLTIAGAVSGSMTATDLAEITTPATNFTVTIDNAIVAFYQTGGSTAETSNIPAASKTYVCSESPKWVAGA